jgi:hypothetical protein
VRKHLLWATTLLTAVMTIGVMVSDIVFRSNPEAYAKAVEAGASPRSWDIVGTIMLVVWTVVFVDFWKHRWRIQ